MVFVILIKTIIPLFVKIIFSNNPRYCRYRKTLLHNTGPVTSAENSKTCTQGKYVPLFLEL